MKNLHRGNPEKTQSTQRNVSVVLCESLSYAKASVELCVTIRD